MSEAELLGDVRMIYMEPIDQGRRAVLVFRLQKPITINGVKKEHAGVVLEEKGILELIDGLNGVANMREYVKYSERIIKPYRQ